MIDPSRESGDTAWSDFGEPEAEFRTSYGLPAFGALMTGCGAAIALVSAALSTEPDALRRFAVGTIGVICLALAYYVYELRKWRLWICPAGVIQRHPWKRETIAWTDVREAVAKRWVLARNPKSVTLKRVGPGDDLTVEPAYCNRPHEAVVAVLKAAQDRQIAVRIETVWKR